MTKCARNVTFGFVSVIFVVKFCSVILPDWMHTECRHNVVGHAKFCLALLTSLIVFNDRLNRVQIFAIGLTFTGTLPDFQAERSCYVLLYIQLDHIHHSCSILHYFANVLCEL